MKYTYMDSPVGRLLLAGDEDSLRLIGFPEGKKACKWKRKTSITF